LREKFVWRAHLVNRALATGWHVGKRREWGSAIEEPVVWHSSWYYYYFFV